MIRLNDKRTYQASFSPVGHEIIYVDDYRSLWRVNLSNLDKWNMDPIYRLDLRYGIEWTPDGKEFLLKTNKSIFLADSDDLNRSRILYECESAYNPNLRSVFTADGTRLFLVRDPKDDDVAILDTKNGKRQPWKKNCARSADAIACCDDLFVVMRGWPFYSERFLFYRYDGKRVPFLLNSKVYHYSFHFDEFEATYSIAITNNFIFFSNSYAIVRVRWNRQDNVFGQHFEEFRIASPVEILATKDGRYLIVVNGRFISFYNQETMKIDYNIDHGVGCVNNTSLSADENMLSVAGSKGLVVFDLN